MKYLIILCTSFLFLFTSCNKNRFKVDTEKINLELKIKRFDRDVMTMDTLDMNQSILKLSHNYGSLFSRFVTSVVMIGSPDSLNFSNHLKSFVRDSMVNEIYQESQLVFNDISDIELELTEAFKYIKFYFPEKKIPQIAMHISGFNQSVVATEEFLSISIDNYLGADYVFYKNIAYDYQLQNMTRSKVAPDIILGYLMSEFPFDNNAQLLAGMLSRAKILYLQSVIMQERTEAELMGYTVEQFNWCEQNEQNMWTYIVENKHLYNSSQLICSKYLNPTPFTSYFSEDSPGQAAIWVGFQIIKSYMDNNKDITLPMLVEENDYQRILENSNYKP